MTFATTDLCDEHSDAIRVVAPIFREYGARRQFAGIIRTVSVYEDNVLVRSTLEQAGQGGVLVIHGGASLRCALVGDQIAALAHQNGWAGIIINGAVRDVVALGQIDLGIRALASCPRRSAKHGWGEQDVPVTFGGVTFTPGEWVAADADGIVVAATPLA